MTHAALHPYLKTMVTYLNMSGPTNCGYSMEVLHFNEDFLYKTRIVPGMMLQQEAGFCALITNTS
jgi:hypothetical protein